MPSLRDFKEKSGLPKSIRRWSEAIEAVKTGQEAIQEVEFMKKESEVLKQEPVLTPVKELVQDMEELGQDVEELVQDVERPEFIMRDDKDFQSLEKMHEWYPEISRHLDAVPLVFMLEALELDSFQEFGTLWIQDIGSVSNAYYTFEYEENTYDKYLIPKPSDWSILRDYLPDGLKMDQWIGYFESVMKSDIRYGFIAPTHLLEEAVEQFKVRPFTWNFKQESWLVWQSFRGRDVGNPTLMESYDFGAHDGRPAISEPVPNEVRTWYNNKYGNVALCETCSGVGLTFDYKTYQTDYCETCDSSGLEQ